MSERICEDAERGMGVFGASHNADGTGDNQDGAFVVSAITEVRSIDIVTDPATVRNLWESRISETMMEEWSDAARAAALAARKAKSSMGNESYDKLSAGANKASMKAGKTGDHQTAVKAHKEAASAHEEASKRWASSSADDARKLRRAHYKAAEAHRTAAAEHHEASQHGPPEPKQESRSRAILNVKTYLETRVLPDAVGRRKTRLEKLLQENKKALLEVDMMAPDDGEAGKDHKDHLYSAMRACEEAGDDDMAGKIHKLMSPEKPEKEETDKEKEPDVEGEGEDSGEFRSEASNADDTMNKEEKKAADERKTEARKRKQAPGVTTLSESRARSLCELAGIDCKPATLNAVIGLTEAKAVEILKLVKGDKKPDKNAPRSQFGGTHRITEGTLPKDAAEQAKCLMS